MELNHRAGGLALALGYGLLIVALFRDSASGYATATDSAQTLVFFLLLPVAGLASGAYVFLDLPLRTVVAFMTGSYLAFVGLAVLLLSSDAPLITVALGLLFVGLAVVALVSTLSSTLSAVVPELDTAES